MIIGIGHDITAINRIEKMLDQYGDRFIQRVFTAEEQELAESRREAGQHNATYAKRFAAKEACVKALGTGVAEGIYLKDIGVSLNEKGKPRIILTGGALEKLKALTPPGQSAEIHLSLTDEPPYASAYVIIEACKNPQNKAS